ncbi:MD2BP protein, partial [Amia calva]|nr:MD2BP protein [Amia calva]
MNLKNAADAAVAPSPAAKRQGVAEQQETEHTSKEDGSVCVVFPGSVTQDSCCKFVCELLKFVLYQRQQLPMTYDQLVISQKKIQAANRNEDVVGRRPVKKDGLDGRKCQQTLQDLEEVLQHLESLFSLTLVPRVLLLMGGNILLPKEVYEIDMMAVALGATNHSLETASCLRQLFRTLFVTGVLFDPKPVRLMATTIMVLSHRECGVDWFRPKLDYKVPTKVKRQVISLSCDDSHPSISQCEDTNWDNYIWFQAPVTIKGFCK